MRIHYLQHVAFEGLGSMEGYLLSRGHALTCTRFHEGDTLPPLEGIDWVIVMGGPMGAYDEAEYAWLVQEKAFIRQAITAGKTLLGICLGAQLIAEVLGAPVTKNPQKEIGWFPLYPEALPATPLDGLFTPGLEVFHWHGDTFAIPAGARLIASSKACRNQGFLLDDRIVGLQFHLETTPASAMELIENARHELVPGENIQTEAEMLSDPARFDAINQVMGRLLLRLEEIHASLT